MSKIITKEEAVQLKKTAFKNLTKLLESNLSKPAPSNPGDTDYTKKAALISKWLSQYANYISFEEKFDPKRNISYKRGDVVFVNFGFNVGAELGGEHYAIVLDKNNSHNSSTVTVVPLSSLKAGKTVHDNDVYLGSELYEKMQLKLKSLIPPLKEQSKKHVMMIQLIKEKYSSESADNKKELDALLQTLETEITDLNKEIENAEKVKSELLSLKHGSIAKIQQITTISKIRIYNPKTKYDPLYGIRFSKEAMDKVNQKLKDFYIF